MISIRALAIVLIIATVINSLLASTVSPSTTTVGSSTVAPSNATENATESQVSTTTVGPDNTTTTTTTQTETTVGSTNQTANETTVAPTTTETTSSTVTPAVTATTTTAAQCSPFSSPLPVPNNPSYFQTCINGELITRQCPRRHLFSEFFGVCVRRRFYFMLQRWLHMFNMGAGGMGSSGSASSESLFDD